jgi:autophagy-related protein 101
MGHLVEEKVDDFWRAIESGPAKRGQVNKPLNPLLVLSHTYLQIKVIFSEKRQRKSWFYTEEEEVPWEQWYFCIIAFFYPVSFTVPKDRQH